MRGKRVSKPSQKLDVVLVAARYEPGSGRLDFAQGYVRRGKVWSDLILLRRGDLLEYLARGKRVAAGRPVDMPGNFEAYGQVRMEGADGKQSLRVVGATGTADDLGLPLF